MIDEEVVAVVLDSKNQVFFYNRNSIELHDGDNVVVDTDKGLQVGSVMEGKIKNKADLKELKNIIRIATKDDVIKYEKNRNDALKALFKAREISKKLNLNMKIIRANYTLDRKQLLFYFISENRIDFRNMAKELAAIYKTRIELRQIGVRDRAKEVSGIGQCGRELCCSCFLSNSMESVTINMAKNQNLALNPNKINGQCGRLLCCLNYEDEIYSENRKLLPNIKDTVETPQGVGKVVSLDIINRSYVVNVPDEGKIVIKVDGKCGENAKKSSE